MVANYQQLWNILFERGMPLHKDLVDAYNSNNWSRYNASECKE